LFLGVGLAIGVLVAVLGFRFSFVSADVSSIAKELGDAKVLNVELAAEIRGLEAQVAARDRDLNECGQRAVALQDRLQQLSQRADQCDRRNQELESAASQLQRSLESAIDDAKSLKSKADSMAKALDERIAEHDSEQTRLRHQIAAQERRINELTSEVSEPGRLMKRNAELVDANSRLDAELVACKSTSAKLEVAARAMEARTSEARALRQQVDDLRRKVQSLSPPSVDARGASKVDIWNSLMDVQGQRRGYGHLDYSDFEGELGAADLELRMSDRSREEWSEASWRQEQFPRLRCSRVGWPTQLYPVRSCIDVSRTTCSCRAYVIKMWKLTKDLYGVVVCADGSNCGDMLLGETTLPRANLPDLVR